MRKQVQYRITEADEAGTVETVLRRKMGLTRQQISRAKFLDHGICCNGIQIRTSGKVHTGDLLEVLLETDRMTVPSVEPTEAELEIMYEDQDLLIINKPSGIAVHPAHGHYKDTLANHVMAHCLNKGEQITVRAVGRLDLETSGLVIFAKNRVAAARLSEQKNRNGAVEKTYLALVKGHLKEKIGCIEQPLAPVEGELNRMEVSPKGKPAATFYEVIEEREDSSCVQLRLWHGRTHQIRVHMAWIGHPLLGDRIYGEEPGERAALHCWRIEFEHPFSGVHIKVEAPLPDDMKFQ